MQPHQTQHHTYCGFPSTFKLSTVLSDVRYSTGYVSIRYSPLRFSFLLCPPAAPGEGPHGGGQRPALQCTVPCNTDDVVVLPVPCRPDAPMHGEGTPGSEREREMRGSGDAEERMARDEQKPWLNPRLNLTLPRSSRIKRVRQVQPSILQFIPHRAASSRRDTY